MRNNAEEDNKLNDSIVMDIIKKMIKQRNLAIDSFKKANRLDLVEKEELEANYLVFIFPSNLMKN